MHEDVDATEARQQVSAEGRHGIRVEEVDAVRLGGAARGHHRIACRLGSLGASVEQHDVVAGGAQLERDGRAGAPRAGDDGDRRGAHAVIPAVESMVGVSLRRSAS